MENELRGHIKNDACKSAFSDTSTMKLKDMVEVSGFDGKNQKKQRIRINFIPTAENLELENHRTL